MKNYIVFLQEVLPNDAGSRNIDLLVIEAENSIIAGQEATSSYREKYKPAGLVLAQVEEYG